MNTFSGFSGPASVGPGTGRYAATSGSPFYFYGGKGIIGLPQGYVSGTLLAATLTFVSETFASLGVTPGTYLYTSPADTLRINVGTQALPAPEPATWAMMLFGFGLIGGAMRARRRVPISYA